MAKPAFVLAGRGFGSGIFGSGTSLTLAFDATGGDCLYVLTLVNTNTGTDVGGVTYNGVAMTQIAQAADVVTPGITGGDARLWRLVAPATGSNNIVATMSPANSPSSEIHAVLLSGVYAATPEQTPVTDTDLSASPGTVTADQLVLACAIVGDDSEPGGAQMASTGTSQTERTDSVGDFRIYSSMATQTAEGTVTSTFTYAQTADDTAIITLAVNGVDPAGVTPGPLAGEGGNASAVRGGNAGVGGGNAAFEMVRGLWQRSTKIIRPRLVPVGIQLQGA